MHNAQRFIGLELAGAKNLKTSVAILEYYPKQNKTFLLDIIDKLGDRPVDKLEDKLEDPAQSKLQLRDLPNVAGKTKRTPLGTSPPYQEHGMGVLHSPSLEPSLEEDKKSKTNALDQDSDAELLKLLLKASERITRLGVNVPLTLPPCMECSAKICTQPSGCGSPGATWMRRYTKKVSKRMGTTAASTSSGTGTQSIRVRPVTSYTQRPVELWIRYELLPGLPKECAFEIDEALGGNKAPLTARMHFLKKRLKNIPLCETSPKLTIALLTPKLGLPPRAVDSYRDLENGAHFREEILQALTEKFGIFVYEHDQRKLIQNLGCFDAFLCGLTALLSSQGQCVPIPEGFPKKSGWIEYPR